LRSFYRLDDERRVGIDPHEGVHVRFRIKTTFVDVAADFKKRERRVVDLDSGVTAKTHRQVNDEAEMCAVFCNHQSARFALGIRHAVPFTNWHFLLRGQDLHEILKTSLMFLSKVF